MDIGKLLILGSASCHPTIVGHMTIRPRSPLAGAGPNALAEATPEADTDRRRAIEEATSPGSGDDGTFVSVVY